MTRITSMLHYTEKRLLNNLQQAQAGSALASLRISEEKYVLGPSTNPSTFVALSMLDSELTEVQAASKNATAASSMLTTMTSTNSVFDQVIDQLESIQTILEDDTLTPADAQAQIDTAIQMIDELAGQKVNGKNVYDGSADYDIRGVNSSQVSGFRVFSKANVGLTQTEKAAELMYTGTDRFVTSDANLTINGPGNSFTISAIQGETLESLASRVNQASSTNSSGVIASVDDNKLTFRTSSSGADQQLEIMASGDFDITDPNSNTSATKDYARFTYTGTTSGGNDVVTDDAIFTVTGDDGQSSQITVTGGATTLTSLAATINGETDTTGVVAEVSGTTLTLRSQYAGNDHELGFSLLEGTFDIAYDSDLLNESSKSGPTMTIDATVPLSNNPGFDVEIEITGSIGTDSIIIADGSDLATVVGQINTLTATTGVTASPNVGDTELILTDTVVGDNNKITLTPLQATGFYGIAQATTVTAYGETTTTVWGTESLESTGQDAVLSSGSGAVAGTIHDSGSAAQLTYTGDQITGEVIAGEEGDWIITGPDGSTTITVSAGMLLNDLAIAINNESHNTGVVSEYDPVNKTVQIRSIKYGSTRYMTVDVDGKSVKFTGGQGNNSAYGTDATATINGREYIPDAPAVMRHRETGTTISNDATLTITGDRGSADVTLNNGDSLQDAADAINATTTTTGVYAQVDNNDLVIKSQVEGSSGDVQLNLTSGVFSIVEGFQTTGTAAELTYTGASSAINGAANITITGPIGGGTVYALADPESLYDVADRINLNSTTTGVKATVDPDNTDDLIIYTENKGSDTLLQIGVNSGSFVVSGGNGDGTANGTDSIANAEGSDGQSPSGWFEGNTFNINQNGFHYQIELAEDFTGDFTPITVQGNALSFSVLPNQKKPIELPIPSLHAAKLGGSSGKLSDLISGGQYSGLGNNTSTALRIVSDALDDVNLAKAQTEGVKRSHIDTAISYVAQQETNLEDAITITDGYNEQREILVRDYYDQLSANTLASMEILVIQRNSIFELLRSVVDYTSSSG